MSTHVNTSFHKDGPAKSPVILEEEGTSRARGWCLTINTYNTQDIQDLKNCSAQTVVFQSEKGASGNNHLQCVIYFKNSRVFRTIKTMFPTAHIEQCRNLQASVEYCSKNATYDGIIRYRKIRGIIHSQENNIIIHKKTPLELKIAALKNFQKWMEQDIDKNPEEWRNLLPNHYRYAGMGND